ADVFRIAQIQRRFAMPRISRYLTIALGSLMSLWLPEEIAAVQFAPAASYAVGGSPSGVVVGAFNGDGKMDLAVVNECSGTASVLLGNGNGTFQAAKSFATEGSPGDK